MAELDNTEARSVVAFLTMAGRQPDDMLRFFDRKDYFCLVGRDADTVAVEYFKSTACIKHVQSGGERRSYLSINKKMASEVMRAALLEQRRRVEGARARVPDVAGARPAQVVGVASDAAAARAAAVVLEAGGTEYEQRHDAADDLHELLQVRLGNRVPFAGGAG